MKYFLTLIGVAAFVAFVFAFKSNFIERNFFSKSIVNIEIEEGRFTIFGKGEKGNGKVIDQEREINAFTSVASSNAIQVKLLKGNTPKVVVRTDDNLQKFIKTEIKGSELKIYVRGSIRKYSEMTVFVTFTELEALKSSSASDIVCQDKIIAEKFSAKSSSASSIKLKDLQAKEVKVEVSSASNIKIAGECDVLDVEASSAADANLYDLKAKEVNAEASSAADIQIFAILKLVAEANSAADITYKGEPKHLETEESSGGDVSQK